MKATQRLVHKIQHNHAHDHKEPQNKTESHFSPPQERSLNPQHILRRIRSVQRLSQPQYVIFLQRILFHHPQGLYVLMKMREDLLEHIKEVKRREKHEPEKSDQNQEMNKLDLVYRRLDNIYYQLIDLDDHFKVNNLSFHFTILSQREGKKKISAILFKNTLLFFFFFKL